MTGRRRVSPGQVGVGAHGAFMLQVYGHLIEAAFGHIPYVVVDETSARAHVRKTSRASRDAQ